MGRNEEPAAEAQVTLQYRGFCTACKANFSASKEDHNKEIFCPGCDRKLILKVQGEK